MLHHLFLKCFNYTKLSPVCNSFSLIACKTIALKASDTSATFCFSITFYFKLTADSTLVCKVLVFSFKILRLCIIIVPWYTSKKSKYIQTLFELFSRKLLRKNAILSISSFVHWIVNIHLQCVFNNKYRRIYEDFSNINMYLVTYVCLVLKMLRVKRLPIYEHRLTQNNVSGL